jgi:hypothetical protein
LKHSLETRLRRTEAAVPVRPALSAPWHLLTTTELVRLMHAMRRGTLTDPEAARWKRTAHEREAAGMTPSDVGNTFPEREADGMALDGALRGRHGFAYSYVDQRFDAIDLTTAEVKTLRHLIEHAQTIDELRPVADMIGRCWFDSRPCSIESFAAMVLRGECPPPTATN